MLIVTSDGRSRSRALPSQETAQGEIMPTGRWRVLPEIPATANSQLIPAKTVKIGRTRHAAEWLAYSARNPGEVAWAVAMYGPGVVLASGFVVAAADAAFGLGVAQDMANVQVNPNADGLTQTVQDVIHIIGSIAVDSQN